MAKTTTRTPTPTALRRVALKHQALLGQRPIGRGVSGTQKALEQLGYVQIDTISVVSRAHHHTLWARVGNYDEDMLNKLIARGDAFEYWYHAAAYLPMRDYRFALPRMRAMARFEDRWIRSRDVKLMRYVLDRVTAEGALRARDFEDPRERKQGWWDWKPAKRALEQLFMQGDLMSVGREGFQKRYDLAERVLPNGIDIREPSIEEYAQYLLDTSLASHGFATAKAMTHGRPGAALRTALKGILAEQTAADEIVRFQLGAETFYARPDVLETKPRPPAATVRLLSPFDNSIIHRERAVTVHDFDYQLECYVTEAKRHWGYFCLPILYGDQFVGRMDCKAHRDGGRFEIKNLYLEREVDDGFDAALAAAVRRYAGFNGCQDVDLTATNPAHHHARLRAAMH